MSRDDCYLRQVELLEFHCQSVVADLEVQDVIPELLEKLVIGHDDKQRIEHEKTYEDRANVLVETIQRKAENGNTEALSIFVNSLKSKYPWLHSKLTQDDLDFNLNVPEAKLRRTKYEQQKIRSILESGGVQCLPRFTIDREELVDGIRAELKILRRQHYVVLTGMAGCGKSVLASQAVHHAAIVSTIFKDGIFWLPIGKESSETTDAILAKMRTLCDKLGEIKAPNSIENGAELLRTSFLKRPDSLLILDDVWKPEVIKAFDVGCRTLVITRDMSVMDAVANRLQQGIRIPDGFTEMESLELFCQSLGTTLDKMPEEANSIHAECKGSPMVISLISALFQDQDVSDKGRWSYYLSSLRRRRYSQLRKIRDYEHESVLDAISLSVESLELRDREYYYDFALFQDDCGIPCPVLMILWNLGKYEVEDIMSRLVRKNLAIDEYDSQRKCKVYSVHDLQLDYLKFQSICDGITEEVLHQKLINQYLQHCGNQFEKLSDDGYIHFYLGYHLYKARKTDYFSRAYLNLLFIGEKLRITGTADLLVDLRRYKEFIIGDAANREERSKFIEEITALAQSIGHRIYNQTDADIIQISLEMPHLPCIYKLAKDMALRTPNRLYIDWINATSNEWKNAEAVVLCTDNVKCVKFVGNVGNHFLAALNNGCIELCDLESCRICHIYSGHSGPITSLDVLERPDPDDGLIFLSSSEDRTCKLWNLKATLEGIESSRNDRSTESSPSPKIVNNTFWGYETMDESYLTFEFHTSSVLWGEFSRSGDLVISTSFNEVLIWSTTNGQIISKISPSLPSSPNVSFQACHFSRNDDSNCLPFLLMSCENQVVVYAIDTPSLFSAIEGHHMKIVALLQLPHSMFCTVAENELGFWSTTCGKTPTKSRSLSPRRSFPLNYTDSMQNVARTKVDALPINPSAYEQNGDKLYKPGELLRPSTTSSRNSSLSSGRDSPTLISDCYSPAPVHTIIDNGTNFVKIFRDEVLPKRSAGLYQCAAVTESGELLACGTSDRRVMLWNLEKRLLLGEFSHGNLRCLDFSKVDPWTLLSGSEDHTVMVWDLEEEQKGRKEPQKGSLYSCVFIETPETQDHSYGYFISLFSTDSNSVQIYFDSRLMSETCAIESPVTASAIKSDGSLAIVGTKRGKLYKIRIAQSWKEEAQGQRLTLIGSCDGERISHLLFHENGGILIAATVKGNILVFSDLQIRHTIQCECESIISIQFLFATEMVLVILCKELLMVQNIKTDKRLKGWKADENVRVICSEASLDSRLLAVGTARHGIFLFGVRADIGISQVSHIMCSHNTTIRCMTFNYDKSRLAVGHDSGLLTIWKVKDYDGTYEEELNLILHKGSVRSVKFSADSKWLCSCGDKLGFWTFEKPLDKLPKPSFMAERRRKKSGETNPPNSRLSLEIGEGTKIGRKGKRELLQSFFFRGAFAQTFTPDSYFKRFITVDESGIFYLLEILASNIVSLTSSPQSSLSS